MQENHRDHLWRPTPPPSGNIAELLFQKSALHPNRCAIIFPSPQEKSYSYADIQERVCSLMGGLRAAGLEKNDRVLILFPVSLQLYTLIAAIYAIGAVAVLVDPGMGVQRILSAIKTAQPKAIVSVGALLRFRWFIPTLWRIPLRFSIDSRGWGMLPFSTLTQAPPADPRSLIPREEKQQALITFTSGSTGAPKGADRHHQFLFSQHDALCRSFPIHENQIDMTCFPVVVFHNLSCGITTIIPDCDISKPATVEPQKIVAQVHKHGVTSLSAAPIFIDHLVQYLKKTKQSLPSLRQLALGGAPISTPLQQAIYETLPQTHAFAVYGSTEAEPMAHHHIQPPFAERDAFVGGKPVDFVQLKIVSLPSPLPNGTDLSTFETEIGEIIVAGEHVNEGYIDNPKANAENKIRDHHNRIWHRTGDRGYQDENGCIWLTGRNNDVVHHNNTLFDPYPIESRLLRNPKIQQAALIEHQGKAVLFLSTSYSNEELLQSLPELLTQNQQGFRIATSTALPVDGRHNSKIDRPTLRKWLKYSWWYKRTHYQECAQ